MFIKQMCNKDKLVKRIVKNVVCLCIKNLEQTPPRALCLSYSVSTAEDFKETEIY